MSGDASLFISPPDKMLRLLQRRLPHSLILFRKLQYLKRTRSDSPIPEIIFTSNGGNFNEDETSPDPEAFTVAYMNTSGRASTAMYIYSTLEDGRDDGVSEQEYERQLGVITREAMQLRQTLQRDQGKAVPEVVVLGALNTSTGRVLEKSGRLKGRPSSTYDNWILEIEKVPKLSYDLQDGMFWDTATLDDCRVVASRTDIPRPPEYLAGLPSLMVKLHDTTPVAWAFLDTSGSLVSVHCEEPYRKRGLARKVSAKILHERLGEFGPGGLSIAHVAPDNVGSRAMCKTLGGYSTTSVSWVNFDIGEPAGQMQNGHK